MRARKLGLSGSVPRCRPSTPSARCEGACGGRPRGDVAVPGEHAHAGELVDDVREHARPDPRVHGVEPGRDEPELGPVLQPRRVDDGGPLRAHDRARPGGRGPSPRPLARQTRPWESPHAGGTMPHSRPCDGPAPRRGRPGPVGRAVAAVGNQSTRLRFAPGGLRRGRRPHGVTERQLRQADQRVAAAPVGRLRQRQPDPRRHPPQPTATTGGRGEEEGDDGEVVGGRPWGQEDPVPQGSAGDVTPTDQARERAAPALVAQPFRIGGREVAVVDEGPGFESELRSAFHDAPAEDGVFTDQLAVGTARRLVPPREPAGELDVATAVGDVAGLEEPTGTEDPDRPRPGAVAVVLGPAFRPALHHDMGCVVPAVERLGEGAEPRSAPGCSRRR